MRRSIFAGVLAAAAVLGAGGGRAQAPPNPLDVIPDKMPFDVPAGTAISLERANAVIAAVIGECMKHDWKENIAVVDFSGNLVAFSRMDGAQLGSIAIAQQKARTAALFRRDTKIFEGAVQAGYNYLLSIEGLTTVRAGIPLLEGGKIIGAVGVSGGTGAQDEVCAKAGAAVIK